MDASSEAQSVPSLHIESRLASFLNTLLIPGCITTSACDALDNNNSFSQAAA